MHKVYIWYTIYIKWSKIIIIVPVTSDILGKQKIFKAAKNITSWEEKYDSLKCTNTHFWILENLFSHRRQDFLEASGDWKELLSSNLRLERSHIVKNLRSDEKRHQKMYKNKSFIPFSFILTDILSPPPSSVSSLHLKIFPFLQDSSFRFFTGSFFPSLPNFPGEISIALPTSSTCWGLTLTQVHLLKLLYLGQQSPQVSSLMACSIC